MSFFRLPRRIKTNGVDIKGKIENVLKTQGPNRMKLKHYDQIENTPKTQGSKVYFCL
jgi:hypothetical protein